MKDEVSKYEHQFEHLRHQYIYSNLFITSQVSMLLRWLKDTPLIEMELTNHKLSW